MIRLFFWTAVFVVVGGLSLRYQMEIPWVSYWFGKLPGDLLLRKNDAFIYFPIVSAAIVASVFSIVSSLFRPRRER